MKNILELSNNIMYMPATVAVTKKTTPAPRVTATRRSVPSKAKVETQVKESAQTKVDAEPKKAIAQTKVEAKPKTVPSLAHEEFVSQKTKPPIRTSASAS